ncbi:MAG: DNA gyrase subunit A [Acidobacteria bacterium]|nr:MAG: DNA gyrase subunit A [Acidobacteria bacterium 13_2_20CM_58_27]PYT87052.1 MAG: DNA gyrase subunit A [Acidobacteriota bacterium]
MPDEQNLSVTIPVDIEAEMKKSYLDYSMSVIIGRALPEVRDGLKPVHRRILYGMYELGLTSTRPYRKCAKIVGEVLGKYHPHGDTPVYDALVRMAQDFNMRYPLVDGQGNFGSVDGDMPAAMRYTEARLARIAEELLADIERETVDFVPNFDETEKEPVVLPTRIPNLLVNGASGIAVGMATNIPPHNLREIIDATLLMVEKPETTLKEVMKLVPGPDFPTGGYIAGREGIEAAYKSGRGSFTMRAKAAIEEVAKDRENIVITEIPYQVNKATLIKRIAELAQNKKIEGISDVRDESDREGMRIVVELKRGEESQLILNNLYKHTQMQESFGMILLAIAGGQPKEMGLVEFIRLFIEHRRDVVLRRTRYDLRKAREREHILVGYQVALDHLDDVIRIIRGSEGRAEAKQNLLNFFSEQDVTITENGKSRKISGVKLDGRKYKLGGVEGETARTVTGGLTPVQVDAILELQLHRLTQLSVDEIIKELKTIRERIVELEEVLSSEKRLKSVISSELKEVQKQYGDDRRTQIVDKVDEIKLEDLIADTDMLITVSHAGYVKRTPVEIYRHQSRGGKGRIGARTKEEDFVEHLFIASAHSYILLFTTKGRVYWLKVYEIPEAAAATRGKAISSLVRFQEDEKLSAIVAAHSLEDEGKYVFFATRNGTVKKSALKEFSNPRPSGIIAINLEAKDEMIGAKLSDGKKMIFLASHEGQAILFRETEVRPMGRNAGGVIGMDLAKGDYVVSMDAVQPDFEILAKEHKTTTQDLEELENEQIKDSLTSLMLTVSEKGYGKRTLLAEYRITSRGGKGVVNMKTTDRNGSVVAALQVTEESDVMIITHNGKVIRVHANEIREAGRSTQGVHLLRLDADDSVAAAVVLQEENEEEKK